jgi:hypothetical protein
LISCNGFLISGDGSSISCNGFLTSTDGSFANLQALAQKGGTYEAVSTQTQEIEEPSVEVKKPLQEIDFLNWARTIFFSSALGNTPKKPPGSASNNHSIHVPSRRYMD